MTDWWEKDVLTMRPGIRKRLFLLMLLGCTLGILFLGMPMLYGIYEMQALVSGKDEIISRAVSY